MEGHNGALTAVSYRPDEQVHDPCCLICLKFPDENLYIAACANETAIRNGLLFQFTAGLSYGGNLGYALARGSSIRALLELEGSPLQGELIAM
jgi:hypothetical protein